MAQRASLTKSQFSAMQLFRKSKKAALPITYFGRIEYSVGDTRVDRRTLEALRLRNFIRLEDDGSYTLTQLGVDGKL